jgi:type I restriction enzyme S subunit
MAAEAGLYSHLFENCPETWAVSALDDAIDFREGPGILAKDFRDKGVPLLRLRNIERPFVDLTGCDYLDPTMVATRWAQFRVEPGDLLVSTSGTLGRVSIVTAAAAGAIPYTGIIRMRPRRSDVDPGFIRYFLTSPLFQWQAEAVAGGSVLKHYGPSHLRQMSFPIPTPGEQRAIAEILGSLDDGIEQNRHTAESLERLAGAVFRAWFVNYEPVKAKAAGAVSFPGMPQNAFNAIPDRLTDSELGLIPEGWEVGTLGHVARQRREQFAADQIKPGTPYIGLEHMPRRSIALTDWGIADAVASTKFRFDVGDILFGKLRPYFHKVGPAPLEGVCSTDIVVLAPKHQRWFEWIVLLVSSDDFVSHTDQTSTGTKMPRTNWSEMSGFRVALPPVEIVEAFQTVTGPVLQRIKACICESRKLASVRDGLLPQLISGELRVGR